MDKIDTKISIIVALAKDNRAIGKKNGLLWHIPEDLAHFKKITYGHPIIMGRKTYESIGRPLPGRLNIIVTRNSNFKANGCTVVNTFEGAIEKAKTVDTQEVFIIGGAQLYNQALPIATKLYMTIVEGSFEADVFFPDYSAFHITSISPPMVSGKYTYTFTELSR